MEIARFVEGESVGEEFRATIADILRQTVDELVPNGNEAEVVLEASFSVLRGTFYGSSTVERRYLAKLSRTYILLFLLKNDPQTVDYFSKMSSKLTLYVGADIIIRTLSEYYLAPEDQMTANMLKVIKAAGSTLILTQKTLDEVWTSIRATAFEFDKEYRPIQHHIDLIIARNFPKTLTRSYFYAKLDPDRPGDTRPDSFPKFLGNFLDYNELMSNPRQDSLQAYLVLKLGLRFEPLEETLRGIDVKEVEALRDRILETRRGGFDRAEDRNRLLAYNDALHVHRIYRKRRDDNDDSPANRFGFSTWWLTQETAVRRATREIVRSHGNRMYMLRPEFVLNFISYNPRLSDVRHSFEEIFPSLLGVRLSSRLKDEVFRKVVSQAKEVAQLDDARAGGMLAQLANDLKTDLQKHYDHSYRDTRTEA